MSKSINYETKVKNTKDGSIVFGHIHEDQVKSSLLLHGQKAKDYITMDQTAPREGGLVLDVEEDIRLFLVTLFQKVNLQCILMRQKW